METLTPVVADEPVVPLDHPRFHQVWQSIFIKKLTPDCMTHDCAMVDRTPHLHKLDACCQYGCDVDLIERDAILSRESLIRPLLREEIRNNALFETEIEEDEDYPSGKVVRTAVHNDGCIFLAHDLRGCAIHRASIEQGWDFHGVKPAICRLFPLSYEDDSIVIADEFNEYSCAHVEGPSLYRITRDALGAIFGPELVTALDVAEATVLGAQPKRLPVL